MTDTNETSIIHPGVAFIEPVKATAEWSIDENFGIAFRGPWKKPNLFVRTMQRLILGIYWRDVE
jgi:hypothetical protein